MRILVLGGTKFVGRHFVEAALAGGHEVTLFHRGQTNPGLFPDCKEILGDRKSDAEFLLEDKWDAVADICGYRVVDMQPSVDALKDRCDRYLFISTISVYDATKVEFEIDETSPLLPVPEDPNAAVDAETYGGHKVGCENLVNETFGDRAVIVRPGMVVGPKDHTNRFHKWVREIAIDPFAPIPARLDQPCQWIDTRDLAKLSLAAIVDGHTGVANGTGPAEPATICDMLQGIAKGVDADWESLVANSPRIEDGPFIIPVEDHVDPIFRCSHARGVEWGLTHRPFAETVSDVYNEIRIAQDSATESAT